MNVLCFVAHPDDETLSCGAAIHTMTQQGATVDVVFANDGGLGSDTREYSLRYEARQACKVLGVRDIHFLNLPDQEFDTKPIRLLVDKLLDLNLECADLFITPPASDVNSDHIFVYNAAKVYARPPVAKVNTWLSCEILSSTEWNTEPFQPNYWMPVSEEAVTKKVDALAYYKKEWRQPPHPRSEHGIRTLAAYRGLQCGHWRAEAFRVEKVLEGRLT